MKPGHSPGPRPPEAPGGGLRAPGSALSVRWWRTQRQADALPRTPPAGGAYAADPNRPSPKRRSPVRRGLWPREEARTRRSGRSTEHTANVVNDATRRRHHIATAAATGPNAQPHEQVGCRAHESAAGAA